MSSSILKALQFLINIAALYFEGQDFVLKHGDPVILLYIYH
jgi:hypothetical protein